MHQGGMEHADEQDLLRVTYSMYDRSQLQETDCIRTLMLGPALAEESINHSEEVML